MFGRVLSTLLIYIRFMICCDKCEEWFHGDCVGVSMAKGREMEKTGEEWCCKVCRGRKTLLKKWSFPLRISSANEIGKETADVVTFTEEILMENFIFVQWQFVLLQKYNFVYLEPFHVHVSFLYHREKSENIWFLTFLEGIENEHWREIS